MDITELFNVNFVLIVLLATAIAMVVNWLDPPTTVVKTWQSFAISLVSTLVAAFLVGWGQLEIGTDIYSFLGFAFVAGGALGGIVTVRAIIHAPEAVKEIV
jgi:hypothetical protein